MAYSDTHTATRRLPSIAGVTLVHALIGYAFISGLAMNVVHTVIPSFRLISIPDPAPPPPNPARPAPSQAAKAVPERPTAPTQVIDTIRPPEPFVLPREPEQVTLPKEQAMRVAPPSKAAAPQVGRGRSGWITTDDYPSAAIRAGEEGTVVISVAIGSDGRVTSCTVTASSGHPMLDAATCRLYPHRARFSPALDAAGTPVASSYADRVRWVLPPQ